MPRKNDFKLDVVSVRLVKDAPLLAERRIISPEDAVDVVGKMLCDMCCESERRQYSYQLSYCKYWSSESDDGTSKRIIKIQYSI